MSPTSELKILLVDDDPSVLSGLRNVLRSGRKHWTIRTAEGAVPALDELAREPADVLVSDMRMPGMGGLELLGKVLETWPATVRVLLSGWADLGSITRAGTVAHRYLLKPCEADTFRGEISGIHDALDLLPDRSLRATLGALRSLPGSPETLQVLRDLPECGEERARAIVRAVENDVALATRVLQFVSSPSFGSPRPVQGLQAALGLLGPGVLREIASLLEPLPASATLPGAIDSLLLMERHAQASSRMARALAKDEASADPAATAALLHDAGQFAMLSRLQPAFAESLLRSRRDQRPLEECEAEVLGATHARIGAYLLGLWGLPRPVVDAVARHHDPGILDEPGIAGLVANANLFAHKAEASAHGAPTPSPDRRTP